MILALLLSCRDEQLAPLADALEHYDRGAKALDAGRHGEAAEAFAAAARSDPQSPVLPLWEARARAAGGDLAAAEALATQVIERSPQLGLAWYNRAAWRVRLGRPAEAAEDLRHVLELRAVSPYDAAADPDFRSVLGTTPFVDLLPPTPVVVLTRGPEGSVFLGSEVEVGVMLVGAPTLDLRLRYDGENPGCVELSRMVEDQYTESGVLSRKVLLYYRAVAPCEGHLGPYVVEADMPPVVPVTSSHVPLTVEAPSTFSGPRAESLAAVLPLPGRHAPTQSAWAAGRDGRTVWAMGRPDETPTLGGRAPDTRLELRIEGTTRAAGGFWDAPGASTVVAGEWSQTVAALPP